MGNYIYYDNIKLVFLNIAGLFDSKKHTPELIIKTHHLTIRIPMTLSLFARIKGDIECSFLKSDFRNHHWIG